MVPEAVDSMEIRSIVVEAWPRDRVERQIPPVLVDTVNAVSVPVVRAVGHEGLWDASHAGPARHVAHLDLARVVVNRDHRFHQVASTVQLEDQKVAVRGHLDFQVPIRPSQKEDLDHLVIPQLVHRARRGRRGLNSAVHQLRAGSGGLLTGSL